MVMKSRICYEQSRTHATNIPAPNDLFIRDLVSSFRCLSALRRRSYTILIPVPNRYRHDSITHANRAATTPIDPAQFWACHKFRSSILFEIPDATDRLFVSNSICRDRRARSAKFRRFLSLTQGEKFSGLLDENSRFRSVSSRKEFGSDFPEKNINLGLSK